MSGACAQGSGLHPLFVADERGGLNERTCGSWQEKLKRTKVFEQRWETSVTPDFPPDAQCKLPLPKKTSSGQRDVCQRVCISAGAADLFPSLSAPPSFSSSVGKPEDEKKQKKQNMSSASSVWTLERWTVLNGDKTQTAKG